MGRATSPHLYWGLLPRDRGSLRLLASNLGLSLGNAQALPSGGETLSTEAVQFRLGLSLSISLPCCHWLNLSKTIQLAARRQGVEGLGLESTETSCLLAAREGSPRSTLGRGGEFDPLGLSSLARWYLLTHSLTHSLFIY